MTFTEAALEILRREGRPLHFKELTERAMTKKLLTFVGRTPELTMQTQLTAAVKKAPGNPFVRVKPGVFGLLRYPEVSAEERAADQEPPAPEARAGDSRAAADQKDDKKRERPAARAGEVAVDDRGRRRRRRGGRGRSAGKGTETTETEMGAGAVAGTDAEVGADDAEEPSAGGLSAEARAAALAETGVLEGNDDMMSADDDDESGSPVGDDEPAENGLSSSDASSAGSAFGSESAGVASGAGDAGGDAEADDDAGDDEDEGAFAAGADAPGGEARALEGEPGRRRRRRRRRRRGGELEEGGAGGTAGEAPRVGDATTGGGSSTQARSENGGETASSSTDGGTGDAGAATGGESAGTTSEGGKPDGDSVGRRIMAPVDAAIEILRAQPPGRGVHVRQIADSAIRRRLIHGEPNEAWRVIRTALAAEPKDRLRNGLRPRVRSAGSGLFALARRTPDTELEKAEQVFGEARRAMRERTLAAIEKRLADLPPGAFEALARVLLQREGFGPTTFVKRVEGTIYVEALRGRGSRPSKCLIALRPGGSTAGRRTIGELRAGIRARAQEEGLLMLGGRLGDDAIAEWKQEGSPMEIADGAALAETCARHGVGVLPAVLTVDFVDADFFAELAEG